MQEPIWMFVSSPRLISRARRLLLYVLLAAASLVMLFPFAWMLSSSFKPDADIFNFPIQWIPPNLFPQNYLRVWQSMHYAQLLANTTFLAVMITSLQLLTSTLAG